MIPSFVKNRRRKHVIKSHGILGEKQGRPGTVDVGGLNLKGKSKFSQENCEKKSTHREISHHKAAAKRIKKKMVLEFEEKWGDDAPQKEKRRFERDMSRVDVTLKRKLMKEDDEKIPVDEDKSRLYRLKKKGQAKDFTRLKEKKILFARKAQSNKDIKVYAAKRANEGEFDEILESFDNIKLESLTADSDSEIISKLLRGAGEYGPMLGSVIAFLRQLYTSKGILDYTACVYQFVYANMGADSTLEMADKFIKNSFNLWPVASESFADAGQQTINYMRLLLSADLIGVLRTFITSVLGFKIFSRDVTKRDRKSVV